MSDIRSVVLGQAAAITAGDVKAVLFYYAPGAVRYTLAPPLRQTDDAHDPEPLAAWLATFEAPPEIEVTELSIVTDGDVAYTTSLDRMTATSVGSGHTFTLWYRATLGLRRIDGEWKVAHEHHSVPFAMDGSLRALVDLEPPA
jgi:ketosteroid isomerase-like protein